MPKIQHQSHLSKKEFIVQTASRLFRENGYSATSMRDLAEAVGVEAASLYNHIHSKAEVLKDICFKVADQFTANLEEVKNSQKSTVEKIETILRFHIHMLMEEFEMVYVMNHDWKLLSGADLENFTRIRRDYEKAFTQIVEEGIASQELRATDPYVAVFTMLSAVRGIELWQLSRKKVSADVLEENMIKHLLEGIII